MSNLSNSQIESKHTALKLRKAISHNISCINVMITSTACQAVANQRSILKIQLCSFLSQEFLNFASRIPGGIESKLGVCRENYFRFSFNFDVSKLCWFRVLRYTPILIGDSDI